MNQYYFGTPRHGLAPRHPDERVTGGFVCQLLLAPEARGGMLFLRLESSVLGGYAPRGMAFAYGLVNRPHILRAHVHAGFREVAAFPVLARPIAPASLARKLLTASPLPSHLISCGAECSVETIGWRFFDFPDRDYRVFAVKRGAEIAGYVALRLMPMKSFSALAVVDLL